MVFSKLVKHARELSDHRYWSSVVQRRVGDLDKRDRYAMPLAAKAPLYKAPPYQGNVDQSHVAKLEQDGYVKLSNIIQPAWLSDMLGYFGGKDCFDLHRPHLGPFRRAGEPAGRKPTSRNYSSRDRGRRPACLCDRKSR